MKNSQYIYVFILLNILLFNRDIYAQIKQPGISVIHKNIELHAIPKMNIELSQTKKTKFIEEKEQGKQLKIDVFAIPYDTLISPSTHGVWITTSTGEKIWTIAIQSENARSINLICEPYQLTPGVKLFICDSTGNEIRGAFTFRNNKPSNVLAVTPINSDYILVEMQMDATVTDYGEFGISRISIEPGYEENLKYAQDEWFGTSASCNVDVNCFDNRNIAFQKYSIVRYVYRGTNRCTGTLVNNTSYNGMPYILTAGHCISSDYEAATAVYTFNYVSPECNGGDDEEEKTIAGSELISYSYYVDFALVKLYEKPPADYKPLYAGWDISDETYDTTYTLHHPEGDVMKIAYNENEIEYSDASAYGFLPNTHWLIQNYEVGSTEAGSSGSSLFSEQNKIIGTLTAGNEVCTEDIEDIYQELAYSWDYYSDSNSHLKTWLDPLNTNQERLSNYEPYSIYRSEAVTTFNLDTSKTLNPNNNNLNWGYVSGHNYLYQKRFAEKFYAEGYKYIDAIIIRMDKLSYSSSDSKIALKVWNNKNEEIYSQDVYYCELIKNKYQTILLSEPVAVDYTYYVGIEIDYTNSLDTIALGIYDTDTNSAFVREDNAWKRLTRDGEELNASLSLGIITFDFIPDIDNEYFMSDLPEISVYPNPVGDKFHIFIKEKNSKDFNLLGYNIEGIQVFNKRYTQTDINIPVDITNLPPGLYMFKIFYDNISSTFKVIKSK